MIYVYAGVMDFPHQLTFIVSTPCAAGNTVRSTVTCNIGALILSESVGPALKDILNSLIGLNSVDIGVLVF